MQDILTKLRALGVHIPEGLTEKQLTNYAKVLNPWTVSTGMSPDGCYATTKKSQLSGDEDASTSYGRDPAEAALKLLLKQLEAGAYSVQSTNYKRDSMSYRAN